MRKKRTPILRGKTYMTAIGMALASAFRFTRCRCSPCRTLRRGQSLLGKQIRDGDCVRARNWRALASATDFYDGDVRPLPML